MRASSVFVLVLVGVFAVAVVNCRSHVLNAEGV